MCPDNGWLSTYSDLCEVVFFKGKSTKIRPGDDEAVRLGGMRRHKVRTRGKNFREGAFYSHLSFRVRRRRRTVRSPQSDFVGGGDVLDPVEIEPDLPTGEDVWADDEEYIYTTAKAKKTGILSGIRRSSWVIRSKYRMLNSN